MQELPFSPKTVLWIGAISLIVAMGIVAFSIIHNNTTVVFCDVGQGDGAYIRIHNRIDMIVDTGAGRAMLHCLGKHMPFYDKTIEIVAISHPQKDHCGGLEFILDHYTIERVLAPPINNDAQFFQRIRTKLEGIPIEYPLAGDVLRVQNAAITFYWPTHAHIERNVRFDSQEQTQFGQTATDPNDFSLIFSLKVDGTAILFTGDAYPHILRQITIPEPISILKVPHHGSHNGLTEEFLYDLSPETSVISVGQNNAYGHPSPQILGYFHAMGLKYRRTDTDGDIVYTIRFLDNYAF
jgi:competence protein ComEC